MGHRSLEMDFERGFNLGSKCSFTGEKWQLERFWVHMRTCEHEGQNSCYCCFSPIKQHLEVKLKVSQNWFQWPITQGLKAIWSFETSICLKSWGLWRSSFVSCHLDFWGGQKSHDSNIVEEPPQTNRRLKTGPDIVWRQLETCPDIVWRVH